MATLAGKFVLLLSAIKDYVRRGYIIFWYKHSMDPRVKSDPYQQPPENEVVLKLWPKLFVFISRFYFLLMHFMALQGLWYCLTAQVKLYTVLFSMFLGTIALIGVTAGAHRLWAHRAYKATWQLRLILMLFQTVAMQYSIYNWARDHRLHHKYSDTDADPHNSTKGFFFSHIGWLLILRHPQANAKIKTIPTDDLRKDKIVMFQYHYFAPLWMVITYTIPTLTAWYCWAENFWISHTVVVHLRHVLNLHGTFLVNSAAHIWGMKPYDKHMKAGEFKLAGATCFGEGWHNYHHVFPWDYRNSEYWDYKLNFSTLFIDLFARVGWAYDLKTVPHELVSKRVQRTGDGSHPVWGWDDEDVSEADKRMAEITYCQKNEDPILEPVWGWNDSDIPKHNTDKLVKFRYRKRSAEKKS